MTKTLQNKVSWLSCHIEKGESMIKYTKNINDIKESNLGGFFVGWAAPLDTKRHYELLQNSTFIVLAIDDEKDKIVGFITALSDMVNSSFIPLLEVLPEYQKRGIGRELVERMLVMLKDINCIDLMCDEDMQSFYQKFGMLKSHGMVLRKYIKT